MIFVGLLIAHWKLWKKKIETQSTGRTGRAAKMRCRSGFRSTRLLYFNWKINGFLVTSMRVGSSLDKFDKLYDFMAIYSFIETTFFQISFSLLSRSMHSIWRVLLCTMCASMPKLCAIFIREWSIQGATTTESRNKWRRTPNRIEIFLWAFLRFSRTCKIRPMSLSPENFFI